MRFINKFAIAAAGMFLLAGLLATTDASAQFITRQVIGNGGIQITDAQGNLIHGGTVGQTVAGVSGFETGGQAIYHGYWYSATKGNPGHTPTDPVAGERQLWNAPNPFTTSTTIYFNIPNRSAVRVRVYDMDGRLVRTLVDESYTSGEHQTVWDGKSESGDQVSAGTYYYTLDAQPLDQGGRALNYQQKLQLVK